MSHVLTRRDFVKFTGQGAAVALSWQPLHMFALGAASGATPSPGSGHHFKLGLHNHGSFSEGTASWYAALAEAAANNIDVVYATDHDWRLQALLHRPTVSFTGLQEEDVGSVWTWVPVSTGEHKRTAGGIAFNYFSPNDPSPVGSSLKVVAKSLGADQSTYGFALDDAVRGRADSRSNITGETLIVDVRTTQQSADAWIEMRVTLSYFPPLGGFPGGQRVLSYRFGSRSGDERDGLTGIVWHQVPDDQWTTVSLDLEADVARLFPELPVPGDNTTRGFAFVAVSRNQALAKGWFDYLRFDRSVTGADAYDVQRQVIDAYAGLFPVELRQGDEISLSEVHHCWLFSRPTPIDYSGVSVLLPPPKENAPLRDLIAADVHASGGLVSFAHPFGTNDGTPLADEAPVVEARAAALLSGQIDGSDLLEVGYALRGDVTVDGHVGLWDILSRNERFLTGIGASDPHGAFPGSWANRTNHFLSSVWADTNEEEDLRAAFLGGRVWSTEMGPSSDMELDLSVEGNPMGSVSIRPDLDQRDVTIVCRDVPTGGSVELVQGPVDHGVTHPTAVVVAGLGAAGFVDGVASRTVDTTEPSFVRTQVRDASGRIVGLSNPIWLLHDVPAAGVPIERLGVDTPVDDPLADGEFNVSSDAFTWHRLHFDVDEPSDLLLRLDGLAEGSIATFFLTDPSGTDVASDRSPALVKYLRHAGAQAGRWSVGIGVKAVPTDFRVLVNPRHADVLPPPDSIAAWEGWGSPSGDSWQDFRFQVETAATATVHLDWVDPVARLNLFLRDAGGTTLAFDNSAADPKTIIIDLDPGRHTAYVKIKNAETHFRLAVSTP